MRILHIARSNLAGAPYHISSFLNKYSNFENKCLASLKNENAEYDIAWRWKDKRIQEDIKQFRKLLDWCDILHIHNQPPLMNGSRGWEMLDNFKKPIVMQVHSEPNKVESIYNNLCQHFTISALLVIAQYHAVHMFTENFFPVRNAIDIYDEYLMPTQNNNDLLHITYSPSNKVSLERLQSKWKSTWAYKSYPEVMNTLTDLEKKEIITYEVFDNVPFRQSLLRRQKGDIHIDDIYTGSYHKSSLEGLSQGKVVFANIKDWMFNFLKDFLHCEFIPWVVTDKESLESNIQLFNDNRKLLKEKKSESRSWMVEYWNPQLIVNDYYNIYKELV